FTEEEKVTTFAQVTKCDADKFPIFYHGMLDEGVYLAPSAYEAGFLSLAHSEKEIVATLAAADRVFAKMAK
ncbi:MAG: aspartate aminotransferase family protein, partial [Shewanella sp.]|nr:aspartate aminotransferase family protein [Shewanella sp.]